jgi:hypothetical protein
MIGDTLRKQVEDATISEFDVGPTGISGFDVSVTENPDGTLTGRITKTDTYNDQGTPPGDPLPFEATFRRSQFENVPTQQFGEDGEVTAPDWGAVDAIESDSTSRLANLANIAIAPGGPTAATEQTVRDVVAELAGMDLSSDRLFVTNAPGNTEAGRSVSVYPTASKQSPDGPTGTVLFDSGDDLYTAFSVLDDVGPDDVRQLTNDQIVTGTEGAAFAESVGEARDERDARRSNREAARDAAKTAGVDLDEYAIDARADGEVILQDRDTGRTRTIDADADGGLASELDAETSGGEFVADDADPAAGSTSGGGFGARAAGAIVLLFGALAAALGWLS